MLKARVEFMWALPSRPSFIYTRRLKSNWRSISWHTHINNKADACTPADAGNGNEIQNTHTTAKQQAAVGFETARGNNPIRKDWSSISTRQANQSHQEKTKQKQTANKQNCRAGSRDWFCLVHTFVSAARDTCTSFPTKAIRCAYQTILIRVTAESSMRDSFEGDAFCLAKQNGI